MALILCLETATGVCSVALFRDEMLLGMKESSARNVHSSRLTMFIEALAKESGTALNELDAIAISMGPGSFTGLRIGVATAKGLCYALDKPLIAVPTLQAIAAGMNYELKIKNYGPTDEIRNPKSEIHAWPVGSPNPKSEIRNPKLTRATLFCPMIDARRMEVYCAIYDEQNRVVDDVRAEIIDGHSFGDILAVNRIVFGGDGAEKCRPALESHPNALFLNDFRASARFMNPVATAKLEQKTFENLAYFEPFYLKDFVAGKPRVKGLH